MTVIRKPDSKLGNTGAKNSDIVAVTIIQGAQKSYASKDCFNEVLMLRSV